VLILGAAKKGTENIYSGLSAYTHTMIDEYGSNHSPPSFMNEHSVSYDHAGRVVQSQSYMRRRRVHQTIEGQKTYIFAFISVFVLLWCFLLLGLGWSGVLQNFPAAGDTVLVGLACTIVGAWANNLFGQSDMEPVQHQAQQYNIQPPLPPDIESGAE